jgi:hypothetical protein
MPTTTPAPAFTPEVGDPVVVEVIEGSRVRDPISMLNIENATTVVWSVFFQRRLNDGSISIVPYTPTTTTTTDEPAPAGEEL